MPRFWASSSRLLTLPANTAEAGKLHPDNRMPTVAPLPRARPMERKSMSKPIKVLRRPDVELRVGLKRSALYKAIAQNRFPKPISLGPHSVGWIESEIDAWLAERIAARKAK